MVKKIITEEESVDMAKGLKSMYDSLLSEGFTKAEAMEIIKTAISGVVSK